MPEPTFFRSPLDFRKWLEKNHASETELLVGFYKKGSGIESITWPESVDQALCFGWIDGVRRGIDECRYMIRFTPRKSTSIWSVVNINKVAALTEQGLMRPAGIAAFEKRREEKSGIYSFENEPLHFDDAMAEKFRSNKKAWNFFDALAPSYKRTATYWVMSAKQIATKENRLERLIKASEAGERLR